MKSLSFALGLPLGLDFRDVRRKTLKSLETIIICFNSTQNSPKTPQWFSPKNQFQKGHHRSKKRQWKRQNIKFKRNKQFWLLKMMILCCGFFGFLFCASLSGFFFLFLFDVIMCHFYKLKLKKSYDDRQFDENVVQFLFTFCNLFFLGKIVCGLCLIDFNKFLMSFFAV